MLFSPSILVLAGMSLMYPTPPFLSLEVLTSTVAATTDLAGRTSACIAGVTGNVAGIVQSYMTGMLVADTTGGTAVRAGTGFAIGLGIGTTMVELHRMATNPYEIDVIMPIDFYSIQTAIKLHFDLDLVDHGAETDEAVMEVDADSTILVPPHPEIMVGFVETQTPPRYTTRYASTRQVVVYQAGMAGSEPADADQTYLIPHEAAPPSVTAQDYSDRQVAVVHHNFGMCPVLLPEAPLELLVRLSMTAFDWLSGVAPSCVRSVASLCRQFSFYDMPARTTRPKDIPNSTFAEILERYLLRKAFADALLAGWIGLRWCLVSADHRVRLLRHAFYLRRHSSQNGYRLCRKDHGIVANTVRRMKRLAAFQQNVDSYFSISQLLLLNPSSTLQDVDRMMTRLDGRIDREREQAFQSHMRLHADFEGLFATAMDRMLVHAAKVIAHVRQEIADAKVAIREEVRQELRREMEGHTSHVHRLNKQFTLHRLNKQFTFHHRQRVQEDRQQFAAELQDLRRQSAEAVINAEARTRRQIEDAEARTRREFEDAEARIRQGIRQKSAEVLAVAEARIRWDIRQESADALGRAEARAINAFNNRRVLIEQAPDGAVGGETASGNACYSEQRVKELVASAVAEERERTRELVCSAVAEGLEGRVSVDAFEALSTVVSEKLRKQKPARRSRRGGQNRNDPPGSQGVGDEDGASSGHGAAVGGNAIAPSSGTS